MKNNKTVMPKQAAPVERNPSATAAGAGAGGGCGALYYGDYRDDWYGEPTPFASSDAE